MKVSLWGVLDYTCCTEVILRLFYPLTYFIQLSKFIQIQVADKENLCNDQELL